MTARGREPPAASDRDSALAIAVHPFSDMSPGKDQDDLCEGMAQEMVPGFDPFRNDPRFTALLARLELPAA